MAGLFKVRSNLVVGFLFFLMPVLNFFNMLDEPFSASMYSGTADQVGIYFNTYEEELPNQYIIEYGLPYTDENGNYKEDMTWIVYWTMDELRLPDYAADRYYYALGRKMCKGFRNHQSSGLEIIRKDKFTAAMHTERCSCEKLLEEAD